MCVAPAATHQRSNLFIAYLLFTWQRCVRSVGNETVHNSNDSTPHVHVHDPIRLNAVYYSYLGFPEIMYIVLLPIGTHLVALDETTSFVKHKFFLM